MSAFEAFRESIKDYARDTRVNLSSVLSEEGAPGLTSSQIWAVALSCAYSVNSEALAKAVESQALSVLNEKEIEATKTAATLMSMNNVYYRFVHLLEGSPLASEFSAMPARLRMAGIANHGIDKITFELMSLAVSSVNGCGMCVKSHVEQLKKAGLSNEGIQSSVRIAAVIAAAATASRIS